jgi:hypothetical protein
MESGNNRLLKSYNFDHPFPLTLEAYHLISPSEKRYAVVLAHNSAQHAWHHLISIWEMINEEMLNDLKSSNELLNDLKSSNEPISGKLTIKKLENFLKSTETIRRLRYTPAHVTSFYIYARMFIDRSAAIYPILTSNLKISERKRSSLPGQYYWLKKKKTEKDMPYFQILEKHFDKLHEYVIIPRNKLITHPVCITEMTTKVRGIVPTILYETFSLDDENFIISLLKKYGNLIGDEIKYPKQDMPNTIKMLIESAEKLDQNDLEKLIEIKNGMRVELPSIEEVMEQVDSLRLDLDKFYSSILP